MNEPLAFLSHGALTASGPSNYTGTTIDFKNLRLAHAVHLSLRFT